MTTWFIIAAGLVVLGMAWVGYIIREVERGYFDAQREDDKEWEDGGC